MTFTKCDRCSCPNVPANTMLFVVEPGTKDDLGRERFSTFWFNEGRHDTTEMRASRPGGPSREVVVCGHQGQVSFANVEEHAALARRRDRLTHVVVERPRHAT